ncbi:phage late control D family protein [Frankia sp. CiP1_Cm_nod2]|uniref:phage late control D family protein n=1 Tax=Frankia sp. CiP1_Cm_nod2 TaxID=2897161 RepID=UPI002024BC6A
MTTISYELRVDGAPAGAEIVAAIRRIEVEEHTDLADMVRIEIAVDVAPDGSGWSVLDDEVFTRLTPVAVDVTIGSGNAQPLIDARVIDVELSVSSRPGSSVLRVVGADPSVLMNLTETVRAWPDVADSDIASTLFGEHGLTADVTATQPARPEKDMTTIQRGTDIGFLRGLAVRNGYECYVEANPASGALEGHFHPPKLDAAAQGVLSVNLGPATNVDAFTARFDMVRPTTATAGGVDVRAGAEVAVTVDRSGLRDLGAASTAPDGTARTVLLAGAGLSEDGELTTLAQAAVDRSSWAVVAEGEVNTAAYGRVLRAKRPVLIRGVGRMLSGAYYVEQVLHTFTPDGYTQRFTARRNATGVTGRESFDDETNT